MTPYRREGGAGFATAAPVGQGVWQDDITPGRTLFYRVPVDWGQQLHVVAELGSSSTGSSGGGSRYVSSALVMSLYNPARGYVDDEGLVYNGSQSSAALDPLPPVAYANRYGVGDRMSGMRFAGSYYLVVHLAEQVTDRFGAGPYGLTLRVQVSGAAQDAPGYLGQSVPRDTFAVTEQDREAAGGWTSGGVVGGTGADWADGNGGSDDATMKVVAVSGIGTGTCWCWGSACGRWSPGGGPAAPGLSLDTPGPRGGTPDCRGVGPTHAALDEARPRSPATTQSVADPGSVAQIRNRAQNPTA